MSSLLKYPVDRSSDLAGYAVRVREAGDEVVGGGGRHGGG